MSAETLPPANTPQPELIERVPTAEELKAMYGHPLYEKVSQFQGAVESQTWGVDTQKDKEMLAELRDTLIFGERTAEQGRMLYDVADYIATSELAQVDPGKGADVYDLLDKSRFYARPDNYVHVQPHVDAAGTHNKRRKEIGLKQDSLDQTAKSLRAAAEANGFEWLDPKDAYLVTFLGTGAHEAGHATLAGVSDFANIVYGHTNRSLEASLTYIQRHPEMALTGDLESDVRTHEERFAEGYGQFVVDSALKTLGYSGEQVEFLRGLMQFPDATDIENGELGYSNPLSAQEIVDELAELKSLIVDKQFGHQVTSRKYWSELVEAHKKPDTTTESEAQLQIEQTIDQPVEQLTPKTRERVRALGRSMLKRVTRR